MKNYARVLLGKDDAVAFVVTENCIKCKYMDCVDVCPVDCFHEGEFMLVIDPDVCIDCGVCVPECPALAIVADTDQTSRGWTAMNEKYAALWPEILRKRPSPADAPGWDGVDGKLQSAFGTMDPALA